MIKKLLVIGCLLWMAGCQAATPTPQPAAPISTPPAALRTATRPIPVPTLAGTDLDRFVLNILTPRVAEGSDTWVFASRVQDEANLFKGVSDDLSQARTCWHIKDGATLPCTPAQASAEFSALPEGSLPARLFFATASASNVEALLLVDFHHTSRQFKSTDGTIQPQDWIVRYRAAARKSGTSWILESLEALN